MTAQLGLGLAALGRPGYITLGHGRDVGDIGVEAMRRRCHDVLDAAYARGVRWFDAARSYGRAEDFVASWLAARRPAGVTVSSKWGYRYTAGWQVTATHHEVKDHSRAALDEQVAESRALLGDALALYQVHSVTPDSPLLDDRDALARLAELRDSGLAIGLTLSGPRQREVLERALAIPLWSAVQATWNLYERSVEPALVAAKAAGLRVIVKEALANGRLAVDTRLGPAPDATALAVALAQPFADVVLSGAVTVDQLAANCRARDLAPPGDFADLVEPPERYWAERARLGWN